MLYIFDQQTGTLAALGVMLDCVLSLLRQWTLRSHTGTELTAGPLRSATENHTPSFDTFPPRASAIIYGALLSLILLYMIASQSPIAGLISRICIVLGSQPIQANKLAPGRTCRSM
jgi:hypothetical protein